MSSSNIYSKQANQQFKFQLRKGKEREELSISMPYRHHPRKSLQPSFFINAVARVVGALRCVLLMAKLVCVYSGGKFIFSSVRENARSFVICIIHRHYIKENQFTVMKACAEVCQG